jgi:hypothetical protein
MQMIRQLAAKSFLLVSLTVSFAVAFAMQSANAEPVPLPKIDFEARAKLLNEGTLFLRHSNGKMRIEIEMPQFREPATGFIDLTRKRMVLVLPIPGVQGTAMEVGFGEDVMFGQVIGDGTRLGNDTVAGEPCTIWKMASSGQSAEVCLTQDNIALRTNVTIDGKPRTVFEVTDLKRQPQNPADLDPPADLSIIKLPKGLKGIQGLLPL